MKVHVYSPVSMGDIIPAGSLIFLPTHEDCVIAPVAIFVLKQILGRHGKEFVLRLSLLYSYSLSWETFKGRRYFESRDNGYRQIIQSEGRFSLGKKHGSFAVVACHMR